MLFGFGNVVINCGIYAYSLMDKIDFGGGFEIDEFV
jgi:hypothetical protein